MTMTLSNGALAGLNPAQRDAVLHGEGPLLVLAGAGSGKTRVLTMRIARLIQEEGVAPGEILALTFTNKAAGEMRERIARLLGAEPRGMWSGTFHAIGARFLRRHAALVGRTPSYTIYDESDALAVVKRLMERHRISARERSPKAVAASISDARNALVSPTEYSQLAMDPHARAVALVYADLEPALRQANAVTFDDLLSLPVAILDRHPDIRDEYRRRFRHVLVDEYQDTNRAQYRLVTLLAGEAGNVAVVGDDDQSIYGWRGADIRNILDFERDFPAARVVRLEENYRSTPQILDLANAAISGNRERLGKTLRATRPAGETVTVTAALDERDEADWITEEITSRRERADGLMLRDVAILYRTNAQSRALEDAMRRRGFPYRLVGAVRFYDRREIRDLMAYLRLIANHRDDEAFRRAILAPRRGLGETSLDAFAESARVAGTSLLEAAGRADLVAPMRGTARRVLADFAAQIAEFAVVARDASVDEVLRRVIERTGYAEALRGEGNDWAERMDNVRELVAGAAETVVDEGGEVGLRPLDHFLQRATLVAGVDALARDADAVTMMTMHNAKGLEFPVVFIAGLEDGLFPLSRAWDDPAMLEEERRLFYVGITRAERKLYLSHARSRRRNGETMMSVASSFLRDLPPQLIDQRRTRRSRSSAEAVLQDSAAMRRPGVGGFRAPAPDVRRRVDPDVDVSQDLPRYVPGERVRHPTFGEGAITDVSGTGRDAKVTVAFDDESIGTKRLVIAYAGLERGMDA
jgi:DNA helicase-2/ATP-dependent DNA helicase PcrA